MSTKSARVLVLVCTTRPGALGPAVGQWLTKTLASRAGELGAEIVPVSLGDLDLPFLDEEEHPSSGIYQHAHTLRWSAMVDAADGIIAVTPEYNYGMPAVLKNAMDYLGREWAWKPIGFVSYGNTSAGTRSVQHAKQVVTALRLVPLGATVALRIGGAITDGQVCRDPALAGAAAAVLDELVRVAHALRPVRDRSRANATPGPVRAWVLPAGWSRRLVSRRGARADLERLPAVGVLDVVPGTAHLHQQADKHVRLAASKAQVTEELRVQQLDRLAGQHPASRRYLGDGAAPVGGMRRALDQVLLLQPIDQAGDAGLMDLQLLAELVEG